jgi:hypothetical protein
LKGAGSNPLGAIYIKRKKIEVIVPKPRVYFFFAGFFSSFLTGFLATKIASGFNVCVYLYL